MTARKRTADAAYDRTGYANVADKFVTCVQREGSHSITSDDCDNLLSLLAQCAALREAEYASHAGNCDQEVAEVAAIPRIAKQLAKLDPAKLRAELAEYGAWDDAELADHAQNLQRIVWIACGDIKETHASR